MNTANMVLMCVLCTMIGFAIGNAYGKESMKRTLTNLLNELIKHMNIAAGKTTGQDI